MRTTLKNAEFLKGPHFDTEHCELTLVLRFIVWPLFANEYHQAGFLPAGLNCDAGIQINRIFNIDIDIDIAFFFKNQY